MDTIAKAQAVMTAWDSSMSQARREEERAWHIFLTACHKEDVSFLQTEAEHLLALSELRSQKILWRAEDMEQRNLENARALWLRFVEKNRRDVEEKSDQLKAISNLAALFCGFATVTLSQFSVQTERSWVMLGFYGVLTALVEGLMVISMVTCTLILGSIVKMGRLYVNEVAEEEFMFQCRDYCLNFQLGDRPPCPKRTLEAFWDLRCEKSWQRAFLCFSFGVSAFVCSLILVGWAIFASKAAVTAGLFTFISCVSVVIWMGIQYSWGSYTRKRRAGRDQSVRSANPDGLPFDWTRIEGTARGLAYLHEGCQTRIVHRDIKASNILLDKDLNPKIADFDLARIFSENDTHVSTRVAGTAGYLSPEYALRGHLTEKADVFSFGIVVLELVSGRPNLDFHLQSHAAYLLDWAWQLYEENKLMDLLDPTISIADAICVIEIAVCTHSRATLRPTIMGVVIYEQDT